MPKGEVALLGEASIHVSPSLLDPHGCPSRGPSSGSWKPQASREQVLVL